MPQYLEIAFKWALIQPLPTLFSLFRAERFEEKEVDRNLECVHMMSYNDYLKGLTVGRGGEAGGGVLTELR